MTRSSHKTLASRNLCLPTSWSMDRIHRANMLTWCCSMLRQWHICLWNWFVNKYWIALSSMSLTYRNRSIKPPRKVWKLLWRLISESGSIFKLPKICEKQKCSIEFFINSQRNQVCWRWNSWSSSNISPAFQLLSRWRKALQWASKHMATLWTTVQKSTTEFEWNNFDAAIWWDATHETIVKIPNWMYSTEGRALNVCVEEKRKRWRGKKNRQIIKTREIEKWLNRKVTKQKNW